MTDATHTPQPVEEMFAPSEPLPEAGGIAFTVVYLPSGGTINITARSFSALEAVTELEVAVEYCKEHYKASTGPQKPPEPKAEAVTPAPTPAAQPAPATPAPAQPQAQPAQAAVALTKIGVTGVEHKISPHGKHFLTVKGGKFTKFGVTAWPEVVPVDVKGYDQWQLGVTFAPPASMAFAETDGKKVIKFSAS